MKGRTQIDGNDGIPTLDRKIFYCSDMLNTGIVDENVDAAKARGGRLHHRFDLGWFGHVGAAVIGVHAIVAGGLCLQLGNQGSITKAIE